MCRERQLQAGADIRDPHGEEDDVAADEKIDRAGNRAIELRRPMHAGQKAEDSEAIGTRQLIQPAESAQFVHAGSRQ